MKTHIPKTDIEIITEEISEEMGFYPVRSAREWVKALEARLEMQRREFASLLDYAAENPALLSECSYYRLRIEETKARIADCRNRFECRN